MESKEEKKWPKAIRIPGDWTLINMKLRDGEGHVQQLVDQDLLLYGNLVLGEAGETLLQVVGEVHGVLGQDLSTSRTTVI